MILNTSFYFLVFFLFDSALHTTRRWSQTKTTAAVLYASRHYLRLFKKRYAARLCKNRAQIVGDVFIDPSAEVHKSAKIGPNVSIGPNAKIGKGVRIKESIILADAVVNEHALEGIPIAPNPNLPFAKLAAVPKVSTSVGADSKPMSDKDIGNMLAQLRG
ncbi:Mannose-1-phosphate guanyltransferase [Trichostrongylus colubriformis]|uniref:Mannose-1-phosphate guanyltransferase n=1 Tax=Trichostrongylus colubriformis TaxID=6319 RepID=A0AAN8IGY4_TRICO